ncbi:MAG: hypothetical protein OHK0019_33080 [Saprospiraceae bacterium]
MKILGRILLSTLWFALLTLLTQVGGLVWLLSLLLTKKLPARFRFRFSNALVFIVLYVVTAIFVVPPLARTFGRVPLPVFSNPHLKPENFLFTAFNRHYVRPELRLALEDVAEQMQARYPGSAIWYLDDHFHVQL